MDTYAHDLATLVEALELRNAIHVGHFTGGGEVASYLGRAGHPARSPSRADQCRATTDAEDGGQCRGTTIEEFDKLRSAVQADRSQFWKDLSMPLYGYNRPGAKISEGVRESFWLQGMMCGFPGAYFCVKAFSETDQTEDLKKIDVPTLILHGDDDQSVPINISGMRTAKMIKNATFKIYKGAPHGMCTTRKNEVNEDLFGF